MGESIHNSAQSLMGILNDILDFSKIESGGLTLEAVPFDLMAVTRQVADGFAVVAAAKHVEVLVEGEATVPHWVAGDPGRVRQVLTNLVGNAIKFTKRGSVRVCWEVVGQDGERVVVRASVIDTGVGIPADKTEMVFERFRQADASTTRRFGGTGLGLAISKLLVQAMGGRIFHMGPLGSAAVIKVITNMLAFIHLVADGEALMLAKRGGEGFDFLV